MGGSSLADNPIHLGLGASAVAQPPIPAGDAAMQWFGEYGARNRADGSEGRLVSQYSFTADWDMWEMHPNGAEVVICTGGEITLIQEIDGRNVHTTLKPGEYAINPHGVWHTADVAQNAEAIFITSGIGTEHRPR